MSTLTRRIYVGVGANLEPEKHVAAAMEHLTANVRVVDVSRFYWNEALGKDGTLSGQPRFLNGACVVETNRMVEDVKQQVLRGIEKKMGRIRKPDAYAPRPIDLDILAVETPGVHSTLWKVMDDAVWSRSFVAIPFYELIQYRDFMRHYADFKNVIEHMDVAGLEQHTLLSARLAERIK